MTQLDDIKKLVHAEGFNISMMINKFKKEQAAAKATTEIPDDVYIEVCKEFIKRPPARSPWAYFMKVLILKSHEHCANKTQSHEKFSKTMPQSIKNLFASS